MNKGWLLAALGCALLALSGCTRTVKVTKQMTWECAPDEYNPAMGARADEYVRFRYIEEPRCFDVESARDLCAELQSLGKRVVLVQFRVWGGPKPVAAQGYSTEAVEGTPLVNVGGWGHAGSNDFDGVCPISKVIDSLDWTRSRQR